MSIRLSHNDGYWYLDVRQTPAGAFKADSRHPSIEKALARAEEIMKGE